MFEEVDGLFKLQTEALLKLPVNALFIKTDYVCSLQKAKETITASCVKKGEMYA